MIKRTSLVRYSLIIRMLRKQPSTFDEVAEYLAQESELQNFNSNITKRTFQRDLDDIHSVFDIDIQFDFSKRIYYINDEDQPEVNDRILAAIDIFSSLGGSDQVSKYLHIEKQGSQGTESLIKLLHAIKNRCAIYFDYQNHWDDPISRVEVEPYAIKEFKNRWHLIARDCLDERIRSFALDRLTNPSITRKVFTYPTDNSIEEQCRYSFGTVCQSAEGPQDIILTFDRIQVKHIRTYPLHRSQKFLFEDEDGCWIQYKLCVTPDFVKELLSYGDRVKVLQPISLRDRIRETHYKAFMQYS